MTAAGDIMEYSREFHKVKRIKSRDHVIFLLSKMKNTPSSNRLPPVQQLLLILPITLPLSGVVGWNECTNMLFEVWLDGCS